jgi:hypothetical protein
MLETKTKRPRITLDVDAELRRRIRIAAAQRDLTIGQWCLNALIDQLEEQEDAIEGMAALDDYAKNGGMSWEEYKRRREGDPA